jgi:hypothetical protein
VLWVGAVSTPAILGVEIGVEPEIGSPGADVAEIESELVPA